MKMQRSIGLTFVAISGMIGSGWLFGPLFAAQLAGPAAIVSWVLAGFGMLLIALTYAEISAMFPIAGGLARLPHFSHGNVVSMFIGWAAGMLLIFTVINAYGVRFVAAINTSVTWVKIFVPILAAITLLSLHFDADNLTAVGGFAPNGVQGILAAIASGGVVFAFLGFRHAIDMAGEAHNPQVTVPLSLTLAVIVCIAIYLLVQVAYLCRLPREKVLRYLDEEAGFERMGYREDDKSI